MLGAEDSLGAGQMSVFLCDGRDDPIREQYYLKTLLSRNVDGIIVTGRRTQSRPPIGSALPVPVVYAFISSTDPDDCSVVPDEAGGARKAIEHLLATGRRRIAHITGPEHHHSALVRAAAAGAALADAGLSLVAPPMFGEWSERWGRQAAGMLLTGGADLDAMFCGSDQIARGVADTLRASGARIPDDVALVGFDNWDVMALACQPPLTSLDMDLEGLGRAAADLLLDAINGRPSPGRHVRPCRLILRESTAIPVGTPGTVPRRRAGSALVE
jgi:LacI family transcriptional regulator